MRLIHSTRLELWEFFDSKVPAYAILSHCWDETEVSYHDFVGRGQKDRTNSKMKKIRDCCDLAKADGLDWIWVDTCCIDKSSSAELSEAINSMFSWYKRARICYVFLGDFVAHKESSIVMSCDISQCRWFTRGWTLQELLAPRHVRFFDAHVACFGTKESLAGEIAVITGISREYLIDESPIWHASVAKRMSWASRRSTTRLEDTAYCLLGVFDVNMPLLYGEGNKAFHRLQQAIVSQLDDESIFAWVSRGGEYERGSILAPSPLEFATTGHVKPIHSEYKRPPPNFTSRGLEIHHAFNHPLTSVWDKVCGSIFGGPLLPVLDKIDLRLDCESIDEHGNDYWVGVSLRRHSVTGSWYRQDSSKLLYARQNRYIKKLYPAFVGYKKVYVDASIHQHIAGNTIPVPYLEGVKETFPKYQRSTSMKVLWLASETLAFASWVWLLCALNHHLHLEGPNLLLSWAYLTAAWGLQGQNDSGLMVALLLGMCGWDFDKDTYLSRNVFTALLGLVPMHVLQLTFDVVQWEEWGLAVEAERNAPSTM